MSSATGTWSETSASIVPSASPARSASRSPPWRSGGFRRMSGLKKPMSTSVRCSELMLTSAVTGSPSALAARSMATPAALDRRHR